MANNTIEILTSINKQVSTIANYLAPKNGSGKEATAKLSQGNISSIDSGGGGAKSNLSSGSLKEFIKVIGGLPGAVKAVAGLSGKTINNFKSTMEVINKIMIEIDKTGKEVNVKNTEDYIKNVNSLLEINKRSAKNLILAPAALLGAKLAYPVILAYAGIFGTINKLMKINGLKTKHNVKTLTKSVKMITSLMLQSTKLIAICAGIGFLVSKGGSELIVAGLAVLGATLVTTTAIIALVGLAGKLLKTADAIQGMRQIEILTFTSIGLVAACLALGVLISKGDTQKILLNGLAVLGGTLVTLGVLILLTGFLGKMMEAMGAIRAVKEMTLLTLVSIGLVAMCFALGAIMAEGDTQKILINGLIVLGGTLVALGAIILLTGLLGKLIKSTRAFAAVKDIVFMTFGVMAIIIASKFLGDFATQHHKSIMKGLGYTAAVMVGIVGIGWLAGKLLGKAKKGIIALGAIEILAAGAMGLMFMTSALASKLEGRYDQVTYALLMTTGTIVLFGALAAAASFIMPEIIMGSVALGLALLMATGAVLVMDRILELDKKKDEYGIPWKQLLSDVLGINAVIAAFGLTAAAFSLLTIPILIALPAMAITIGFAIEVIKVVNSVIDIAQRIEEVGGIQRVSDVLNKDIPALMKGFKKKNFDTDLSLWEIGKLTVKYAAVAKLSKNLLDTTSVVSKIANLGTMTEGGLIRPILSIDKENGKIIYGEPVDIVGVARVICDTMNVFVSSMNYNFKDLMKMVVGAGIFKILGTITEPISTFLDILTGFVGGTNIEGNYTLTPVRVDDEGKIIYGAPVPVKDTAIVIMNAVSAFINELYSEENAGKWSQMVYGDRTAWQKLWGKKNTKSKSITEIGGLLGVFITPVAEFIDMLSQFELAGPGKLTRIIVDHDGTIKKGNTIDVNTVATIIGGSITTFISKMYDMDEIDDFDDKTEQLETVTNQIGNVVKALSDLSNNNSIDTGKLTKLYDNFDTGTRSILKISNSISVLDKTLEMDNSKRKKHIREFGEAIEDLMKKFKDDNNNLKVLYSLIKTLQKMDTAEISNKINALKGNKVQDNQTPNGRHAPFLPTGNNKSSTYYGLTQGEVEAAIRRALDGMHLSGGTTSQIEAGNENTNAILTALKNMNIEIDINN